MQSPLTKLLNLQRTLVLLDLETTSADTSRARICAIAMRIHKADGTLQIWKSLINPGVVMPKSAEEVHGISDAIIADGCAKCWKTKREHPNNGCNAFYTIPKFSAVAQNLLNGFKDVDFGGYNVRYDLRVMAEEFSRCRTEFDYSKSAIIDPFRLWQILQPRSLSDAAKYWTGKEMTNAHDALSDITWTEEVLISQLERTELPRNVRELHELSWPRDPNAVDSEGKFIFIDGELCLNFGKFKGQPVSKNRDYVQWMFGASFSPEVKRICDRILAGEPPRPVERGAGSA
jgi:DNA polymerase-3 subunit epsilon